MDVKVVPIAKLKLLEQNPNTHSERSIAEIRNSLERFGQQKPIVITKDGRVIAGNGTLAAAKELGWETLWCAVTELAELEQGAYTIADNRTAQFADWDPDNLGALLEDLSVEFDPLEIGFTDDELEAIMPENDVDEQAETETVEFEARKRQKVSKRHDCWVLGAHRLQCGARDLVEADAVVEAWERRSGQDATLESSGETFREVKDRRHG